MKSLDELLRYLNPEGADLPELFRRNKFIIPGIIISIIISIILISRITAFVKPIVQSCYWNNKAVALVKDGKYEEALVCYDRALSMNPDNENAQEGKKVAIDKGKEQFKTCGDQLLKQGKFEEAIRWYDKSLEFDRNFRDVLPGKGQALYNLSRYEEALAIYNQYLEYNSDSMVLNEKLKTCEKLGDSSFSKNRYKEALEYYDKSLEINPENIQILNKKGLTLLQLGRYLPALDSYELSLEKSPDNKDALQGKFSACLHLGDSYMNTESYKDAIKYYDKILKIYPNNKEVKKKRRMAGDKIRSIELTAEGNDLLEKWEYEKAIQCYDNALLKNPGNKQASEGKEKAKNKMSAIYKMGEPLKVDNVKLGSFDKYSYTYSINKAGFYKNLTVSSPFTLPSLSKSEMFLLLTLSIENNNSNSDSMFLPNFWLPVIVNINMEEYKIYNFTGYNLETPEFFGISYLITQFDTFTHRTFVPPGGPLEGVLLYIIPEKEKKNKLYAKLKDNILVELREDCDFSYKNQPSIEPVGNSEISYNRDSFNSPEDAIRENYNLINSKELEKAYELRSKDRKSKLSYDEFYNIWKENISISIEECRVSAQYERNAVVKVRLYSRDPDRKKNTIEAEYYTGEIYLVKEDNCWKLDDSKIEKENTL